MYVKKEDLYNVIDNLSDGVPKSVLEFLEYLVVKYAIDDVMEDYITKNENGLMQKLEKRIKEIDRNNVCSEDEVFEDVDEILD